MRRAAEQAVKRRTLAFHFCLDRKNRRAPPGSRLLNAASLLGLGHACLSHWSRQWRDGRRRVEPRGRPAAQAPENVRGQAHELLDHLGPATSVSTLMGSCAGLGRNEAAALLAAWRRHCRDGHHATVNALQWLRPGAVWAMDHTRPPGAVDGLYPYILLVRDLASHFQVGAIPQAAATDHAVADILTDLFFRHGAPLVLKSDNHGAFTGRAVRQVLEQWGVLPLVSPPHLPRFNGAAEAGAGHCKTRTHILAARMNRPGRWTADDVEGARIQANRSLRPWGPAGPTPEERWRDRKRVTMRERENLRRVYEAKLARHGQTPPASWQDGEAGAVFRVARADGGGSFSTEAELPRWARIWNASPSPGHRRPWEPTLRTAAASLEHGNGDRKTDGGTENSACQRRKDGVYYQKLRRRSLTDALVESGLLVIRRRRIPLPIKHLMRLKIS